jgi:hypothetical protein
LKSNSLIERSIATIEYGKLQLAIVVLLVYQTRESFVLAEVKTATFNELVCVRYWKVVRMRRKASRRKWYCEIKLPACVIS